MDKRIEGCRGSLLGLAVGDAMGQMIDGKNWQDIQEDYGPNGLLGYDLVNGCAAGSSYTQVAAFAANGVLLGITRGKPELYLRYLEVSLREWFRAQHYPRDPEKSYCWVSKIPEMRVRRCKDDRMLDALRFPYCGTMEKPANRSATPGALPAAVAVGLACGGKGMQRQLALGLGAQTVALTHGNVETFLSGALLAEIIASIMENREAPLCDHFDRAVEGLLATYAFAYPQAQSLADYLKRTLHRAQNAEDHRQQMEQLCCDTAAQCLAGALYACTVCPEDFDGAMILSVNHSGRSAAVGAVTGAILGAKMGDQALPDFYLESLEQTEILNILADDLTLGSPTAGLFDDDWDQKYVQGLPIGI